MAIDAQWKEGSRTGKFRCANKNGPSNEWRKGHANCIRKTHLQIEHDDTQSLLNPWHWSWPTSAVFASNVRSTTIVALPSSPIVEMKKKMQGNQTIYSSKSGLTAVVKIIITFPKNECGADCSSTRFAIDCLSKIRGKASSFYSIIASAASSRDNITGNS